MTATPQGNSAPTFCAVTIDTDGTAQRVNWDISVSDTLEHLQAAVGGSVDVVALHETVGMWVNDNGKIECLPVNDVATIVATSFGFSRQPYFGPAVFTGGVNDQGETQSLGHREATFLVTYVGMIHGKIL